ncbi:RluA family pseudouridine synthase [Ramlibacter sp.]|uniref:RluA family pseudouridine synthase n=1 Tax=Ramlibacter sp. TaxID=1917967 RepID=UPI003D0AD06B
MDEDSAVICGLSEGLVYVDEHLIVLDKPAGLLAVPGRGEDKQDCLSTRAQRLWPDARVVHRLDMATSGLFAMARGLAMQRALSRAFEHREVSKRYVAVVAGAMAGDAWQTIALPLAADWPNRPRQKVDLHQGKPSETRWRAAPGEADTNMLPGSPQVAAHGSAATFATTRIELEPVTGRTHQLRVHLQAIGHPIVGDALYAPTEVAALSPRLLLHASALAFAHPATGEPIEFESRVPFRS